MIMVILEDNHTRKLDKYIRTENDHLKLLLKNPLKISHLFLEILCELALMSYAERHLQRQDNEHCYLISLFSRSLENCFTIDMIH